MQIGPEPVLHPAFRAHSSIFDPRHVIAALLAVARGMNERRTPEEEPGEQHKRRSEEVEEDEENQDA